MDGYVTFNSDLKYSANGKKRIKITITFFKTIHFALK